jgi:hypothetical protein
MVRVLLIVSALAACKSYAGFKEEYFHSEKPWTHLAPPPGAAVDMMAGACKIATHDDDYYGFSVGHPQGWRIDYSTGTLIVSKDEAGLVGALVFPARLHRNDVPPEKLAQLFGDAIGNRIRAAGGSFELTDKMTDGHVATALVIATVNGVKLHGPLQVLETPGFATLKVYWAPETEMQQDESTLRQVLACFKRKTIITRRAPVAPHGGPVTKIGGHAAPAQPQVQALQEYRGRFFHIQWPAGWQITDETEHGIDAISGNRTMAFGFGWVLNPMQSADAYAMQSYRQFYASAAIVKSGWLPAPPGWQIAAIEFAGNIGNYPTHGMLRVAMGQGVMLSTVWTAGEAVWEKSRPTLEAMANSVQIQPAAVAQVQAGIRQQLASYPPVKSQYTPMTSSSTSSDMMGRWASQDRNNQGFDDAILGQDHARTASGDTYVVPYNAWSDTGPQGAGYYVATPGGGSEKLEVQGTDYQ